MISKSSRRPPIVHLKKNVPSVLLVAIVVTTALIILFPILHHERTHEISHTSSAAVKRVRRGVLLPMTHPKVSVVTTCSHAYNLALVPIALSASHTYIQSSHGLYELLVEADATYDEQSNTLCFVQARADVYRLDQHGLPSVTRSGTLEVQLYNGIVEYSTLVASQRGDTIRSVMTDPFPVGGDVRVRATFVFDGTTHVVNGPMSCVPAGMANSTCEL